MNIKRATTPTIRIRPKDIPIEDIVQIIFTIEQTNVKNTLFIDSFTLVTDSDDVKWYQHKMTQEDTLGFNKYDPVHMQVDIVDTNENRSRGLDRIFTVEDALYDRVVTV